MFTIDSENNIVAHAALPAGADASQSFPQRRNWPSSPQNGRRPAWSTHGTASPASRRSTT
jgi:hypothetical protein